MFKLKEMHKTVFDPEFQIDKTDSVFNYQKNLTLKLEKKLYQEKNDFDQNVINEIVLWKVNRYAEVSEEILDLINQIDVDSVKIDEDLTRKILEKLLSDDVSGIQLPMASTILRFRNKNIYQIIDQRVFRIIYKDKKLSSNTYSFKKDKSGQIKLYLDYLNDLKMVCDRYKIRFEDADRVLYQADKRINKEFKLDNY